MRRPKNLLASIFVSIFLVGLIITTKSSVVNAQSAQEVNDEVKDAILTEDWTKVASLLSTVDTQTTSSVHRLIKGHACLALNQNNESLCLFLSATSEDELKIWLEWAQQFANDKKTAVSYYFKGDALARLGQWDSAITEFTNALANKTHHYLALNARGVAYAKMGQLGTARQDFDNAVTANRSFADAHANLGARFVQMKDGIDGAQKAFEKALKYSPNFALAIHGLACVEFILNKDEAMTNLNRSIEYNPCASSIFADNILNIEAYMNGMEKKEMIAAMGDENPGTYFGRNYESATKKWGNYTSNPTQGNYNAFSNAANQLSPSQRDTLFNNYIAPSFRSNDGLFGKTQCFNNKVYGWNSRGANTAINSIESTIMGAGAGASALFGSTGNIGGAAATAAGSTALANSLGNKLNSWKNNNLDFSKHMGTRMQNLGGGCNSICNDNVGGAKAKYISKDYGDWPFEALYGLMYRVKYQETSSSGKVK